MIAVFLLPRRDRALHMFEQRVVECIAVAVVAVEVRHCFLVGIHQKQVLRVGCVDQSQAEILIFKYRTILIRI